ncbi:MAG: hypothetical protein ABI325_10915 [Ginsengibacter sp.]
MKHFIIIICIFFFFGEVSATNLRGQVVRYDSYSGRYYPLAGVRVDFWIFNGKWVDMSYAISGSDGFYYFMNVSPGYSFRVQVFNVFYPQQPLTLLNILPPNFQDIPFVAT